LREKGPLTIKETANSLNKKENTVKKLLWTMKGDGEIKYKEGKYSVFS
jgi:Mn-dependent DtxR family transcriptional regulator